MRQIYARYGSVDVNEKGEKKPQALKVSKVYSSYKH